MTACEAIPHMAVKKEKSSPEREEKMLFRRFGRGTQTTIESSSGEKSHNLASAAVKLL